MAESAEIIAARKKVVDDFKASKKTFQSSGLGGALINTGFIGTVEGIELVPISGGNAFKRTAQQGDQVMNGVVVAKIGENSVTMSLVFEGGRTVALTQLNSHPESSLDGIKFVDIDDYSDDRWKGKTLRLLEREVTQKENVRNIPAADGKTELRRSAIAKYTWITEPA